MLPSICSKLSKYLEANVSLLHSKKIAIFISHIRIHLFKWTHLIYFFPYSYHHRKCNQIDQIWQKLFLIFYQILNRSKHCVRNYFKLENIKACKHEVTGRRVWSIDFERLSLKDINNKNALATLSVYFINKLQIEQKLY